MELLQSIQSSIDIVSKLRQLSKTVEQADFKLLLADLSNDLADAKLEAANLKSELASSRDLVSDLEARLNAREASQPTFFDGGYKFGDDDGIYCTGCFDTKQKKIRLSARSEHFTVFGKWSCPACKESYG